MSALPPPRLLFLDLRRHKAGGMPPFAGLEVITPGPEDACSSTAFALAVLVAVDGPESYADWHMRYQPLCADGFPHIILLDPYDRQLARQVLRDGATDCCALADNERQELIVTRLEQRTDSVTEVRQPPSDAALNLRLQKAIDILPSPIFMKDGDGRYIGCNKAFEDYIGLTRDRIIGSSVYDVAPSELAAVYEKADRDLMASGGQQSYEARVRYADGSVHDVLFHKSVFRDGQGRVDGISGTMLDISDRKALERQLEVSAATDFLTGIHNLRTFYELAGQEFRRFTRSGGDLALVVIDIDRFKEINDTLGHAAGDDALRAFVGVVQENLRDQDIFARAGGDEFRLVLPGTSLSGAQWVAERIRLAVNRLKVASTRGSIALSISAGICLCKAEDESLDDVIARADAALYQAKAAGRNRIHPALPK